MEYSNKKVEELDSMIKHSPDDPNLRMERAILYYKMGRMNCAYNDIVEVLRLDSSNERAIHYCKLMEMVMNFEYKENYNV